MKSKRIFAIETDKKNPINEGKVVWFEGEYKSNRFNHQYFNISKISKGFEQQGIHKATIENAFNQSDSPPYLNLPERICFDTGDKKTRKTYCELKDLEETLPELIPDVIDTLNIYGENKKVIKIIKKCGAFFDNDQLKNLADFCIKTYAERVAEAL